MSKDMNQINTKIIKMWSSVGKPQDIDGEQTCSVWGAISYVYNKFIYMADSMSQSIISLN